MGIYLKLSEEPAECPSGYEPTSNPRLFVIKLPYCRYRDHKKVKKKCCGAVDMLYCNRRNGYTTREKCIKCDFKEIDYA